MKFIVDTQLPPKLVLWLQRVGQEATHPYYLPSGGLMTDEEIREYAVQKGCIIITKDRDFLDYFLLKGGPPCVLLLQFGNISNNELILEFEAHFKNIVQVFEQNANLVIFGKGYLRIY